MESGILLEVRTGGDVGVRLIDADALLAAYDAQHEGAPGKARKLIENAPTVGGWISVKDRLPETNDEVLTTYLYDDKPHKLYVETASYFDDGEGEGHWHSVWDEFSIGRVRKTTIAWMPMPKPYKPSKEDNDEAD